MGRLPSPELGARDRVRRAARRAARGHAIPKPPSQLGAAGCPRPSRVAAGTLPAMPGSILTVGHSNRSLPEFLALLATHGVNALADVRRLPSSRRHPQFSSRALEASLREAGIDYAHLPELGGLRKPRPDSPHTAFREPMFRAYADNMRSDEFAIGLARLLALAARTTTAAMCAEADPFHCHRLLLADALTVRGHAVAHIVGSGPPRPHVLTTTARVEAEGLVYDAPQGRLGL